MLRLEHLDAVLAEDILTSDHPSEFIDGGDYSLLILRLPKVERLSVEVHSYPFVITNEGDIYRYIHENAAFEPIDSLDAVNKFIDKRLERLIVDMQHYHYEIDRLEAQLYDANLPKSFMQQWLGYKKEVSLINRLMFHSLLAYELFSKTFIKDDDSRLSFNDVKEHIDRIERLSRAAKEKLDDLYDFYRAKVDERMNKNMYYLTLISGIFLPLSLITGFFGMNSGGLPYTDDANGTIKVVVIALALEALFITPFLLFSRTKSTRFRPGRRER